MRFDGFYGNTRAKELLSGLVDTRRIPHAILIDGPEGSGRRTLARLIAAAAVCEGDEKPCGNCRQCRNAFTGNHPDIITSVGSGSRSFGVDAVRKIRMDAYVAPNDAARKVYILANIQDMTEQAQNALLKILEEPPSYILFLLTCDARSHVLETVRSRAQCVSLGPVSEEEAAAALTAQCGTTTEEAALAARLSGGVIGRAKKMLGAGFTEVSAFFGDFTKALCAPNLYSFVSLSGKLEKDGGLFASFLDMLPALFRDAIAVKNGGRATLSGCEAEAALLSRSFTLERLYKAQLAALESRRAADRNANLTLHLTALFAQLWRETHT